MHVRRAARHAFTLVSALSLLLCVAAAQFRSRTWRVMSDGTVQVWTLNHYTSNEWTVWFHLARVGPLNVAPIQYVVYAAMILPASWVCVRIARRIWRPRPPKPGLCPACGYDLRAHAAGGRCPECGAAIAGGAGALRWRHAAGRLAASSDTICDRRIVTARSSSGV